MEYIAYGGWPNCIRLSSGPIELVATTDVGPRIIRLALAGEENLFKEFPEQMGKTGGEEWCSYGGHRLWHAPEVIPRTYEPDNGPVETQWDGNSLTLSQDVEPSTGIQKEISVRFLGDGATIRLEHILTNTGPWDISLAPWALSVMAEGGRAIVPQEEFISHSDKLLPARPLVLWHYTDMSDARWIWGKQFIQLLQDPTAGEDCQKAGLLNKQGWAAYVLNGTVFIKRFPFYEGMPYPDYGCNTELYTDGAILEVETLGPMTFLAADGGMVTHVEHWGLFKADVPQDDPGIADTLLPLVKKVAPI
ncbi:MAG: hypothetical protein ACOX5J_10530 [Candidatus Hydrogenedentales bacterium]|jgi:hypothetical protein